jgi:hypothetical protein
VAAWEIVDNATDVPAKIAQISNSDNLVTCPFPMRKLKDENTGIKKLPRDVREEMVGILTFA